VVDKINDSIHKIENILCWQVNLFDRLYLFYFFILLQKKRMIRKTMRELLL
jgi:hypothetical protein